VENVPTVLYAAAVAVAAAAATAAAAAAATAAAATAAALWLEVALNRNINTSQLSNHCVTMATRQSSKLTETVILKHSYLY